MAELFQIRVRPQLLGPAGLLVSPSLSPQVRSLTNSSTPTGARSPRKKAVISAPPILFSSPDDWIAGKQRKKLKFVAVALKVPEIPFAAALEDLAILLAGQKG